MNLDGVAIWRRFVNSSHPVVPESRVLSEVKVILLVVDAVIAAVENSWNAEDGIAIVNADGPYGAEEQKSPINVIVHGEQCDRNVVREVLHERIQRMKSKSTKWCRVPV